MHWLAATRSRAAAQRSAWGGHALHCAAARLRVAANQILGTLILGLFAISARASIPADLSNQDILAQTEQTFDEGVRLRKDSAQARPHFRQAAELFDTLRRRGVSNPLLARNLGNSWLLAGDLPRAILAYRQGLLIAPGDRDLLGSLERARELVVYPGGTSLGRPAHEDRPPWLPRLPGQWLFLGAAVLYVIGCICLTRWLMVRGGRRLLLGLLALAAAVGPAVVVIEEQRQESGPARPLAIIADDGVLLRKGNSLNFPARYETPVNRGVEARLLFERGDWLQIQLGGGEVGWVPRQLVLVDPG